MRNFWKLLMNNLFGKMAQREFDGVAFVPLDHAQFAGIEDLERFCRTQQDSRCGTHRLKHLERRNDMVMATFEPDPQDRSGVGRLVRLAAFVTAFARVKLFTAILEANG